MRPTRYLQGFVAALSLAAFSSLLAEDAGFKTGFDVTLEGAAGLRGGAARSSSLLGTALGHVEWSQAKNADREVEFRAYGSFLTIAGRGPSDRFLGDFLAASNIEGHQSTRVFSWWVEAQRGDWSLRGGALLADEEFIGTEVGGGLVNSAFGWPAFISANTVNTGPAYFVAAPGLRLERTWGETAAWRAGIYDGDAFDSPTGDPRLTRHGLHYRVGGDQGWFAITEATFAPAESANRFRAGAWLHTAKFADMRDDVDGGRLAVTGGDPRLHRRNYGFFGAVERTLAGKKDETGYVAASLRGGFSPQDRNTLGWSVDSALSYTGLLPGRGKDVTTLGFVHASFSSRFTANARLADPASPAPDFEQVIELSHSAALTEQISVQPDLQYIRHPGGSTAQRDALAFLLRLKASY